MDLSGIASLAKLIKELSAFAKAILGLPDTKDREAASRYLRALYFQPTGILGWLERVERNGGRADTRALDELSQHLDSSVERVSDALVTLERFASKCPDLEFSQFEMIHRLRGTKG